jgi:hypothetical protein
MTSAIIKVRCGDATHQVELFDDLTSRILDHDPDMLAAFTAFGAETPWCEGLAEAFRWEPHNVIAEETGLTIGQLALLAADWLEHAEYPLEGQPEIRRALTDYADTVRCYVFGGCPKEFVRAAFHKFSFACRNLPPAVFNQHYGFSAERAADWLLDWVGGSFEGHFDMDLSPTQEFAQQIVSIAEYAGNALPDDHRREDEWKWQIAHALRVIDALNRGKPWPALS